MSASDLLAHVRAGLDAVPYAQTLGVEPRLIEGHYHLVLPFSEDNIGNPLLPALHGGAVGGFLELCAITQLMVDLKVMPGDRVLPKPIGISVDYLRRGRPEDTFARARVQRLGARIANVQVSAWQSDPDKIVATLHGNFLLSRRG